MDKAIESAVEKVIRSIRDNLGEPITIDDMARIAMFSKFHFTRIFQRVTGISPGRFLSALRLQEAKRLLLTTTMTVADISYVVGYNSIGTFSSRFRSSVGVSPTGYRQQRGLIPLLRPTGPATSGHTAVVRGQLWHPEECRPGRVIVGLFPDRIAQRLPVSHSVLPGAGPYELADVPAGTWHLLAHSVATDADHPSYGESYVAAFGPFDVAGTELKDIDLRLRPRRIFDPPTLLAQLDMAMWTPAPDDWAVGGADKFALPTA